MMRGAFFFALCLSLAIHGVVDCAVWKVHKFERQCSSSCNHCGLRRDLQVSTDQVTLRNIGDRTSCPVRPWTAAQTKARERPFTIVFREPFDGPPAVHLTITIEDVDKNYNKRIHTAAQEVTATGFVMFIGTWCNTYIHSIRVNYRAIG